jgi:hypothetical protein
VLVLGLEAVAVFPAVRTSTASTVAVLKRHGCVIREEPGRVPDPAVDTASGANLCRFRSLIVCALMFARFLYVIVSEQPGYSLVRIITNIGLQSTTGLAWFDHCQSMLAPPQLQAKVPAMLDPINYIRTLGKCEKWCIIY